jgi:hypothetical protein
VLLNSCKKDRSSARVEIYLLESYSLMTDLASVPVTNYIENAVLEKTPLVADRDIVEYKRAETTFKLRKDINATVRNYGKDKIFAVTVNGEPVYFGRFYPLFLSSIEFGLATISPQLTTRSIHIYFPTITGNILLNHLDKRNDSRILGVMRATGRLR